MFNQASRNRYISMFLIFSMFITFFAIPTPAKAGMLGSILSKIRPYAGTLGKIGGAVVGAAFCGAFLPPLGLIAGAIGGYIAGGIITNQATSSLTSLATMAGMGLGAMALASFGPIGYIGGALAGGFLTKTLMKYVYKADRATTGGMIFSRVTPTADSASSAPVTAPTNNDIVTLSVAPSAPVTPVTAIAAQAPLAPQVSLSDQIRAADKKYQAAYKAYIAATNNNASNIAAANKEYIEAFNEYKKLTGKAPTN